MSKRVFIWMGLIVIVAALTACNVLGAPETEQPVTAEPGVETPAGQPTDAAQPTTGPATQPATSAGCPAAGEGTSQYVNEAGGYCFLYPAAFTVQQSQFSQYEVSIVGPPLDDSMEPALAFMIVDVVGKPGMVSQAALTASAFADAQMERYAPAGVPGEMTRSDSTIAGQPAVLLDNVPGQMNGREAYFVVNDTLYKLYIAPINNQLPQAQPDADLVWNTITNSLTFFATPAVDVVTAQEVCPTPGDGQQLYISETDGFCVLLPSTFTAEPGWFGVFAGGPELPTLPEYVLPANRVSIAFGWNGYAVEGDTIDSLAQQRIDNAPDPAAVTRQDITIGGQPAVVLEDTADPIGQRTALVIYGNQLISMLIKPTDFNQWPEAQPAVEEAWNLAIGSMQFFDPWN